MQDVFCTTSRTHLPKGACRPLLDTPCGWRGCGIEPFRTRATSGRCITSQGFHAPTPRPSSSRLDSDRASFRAPRNLIDQPLRGLDAHCALGLTPWHTGAKPPQLYGRRALLARLRWMFWSVFCAAARSLAGRCSDAATLAAWRNMARSALSGRRFSSWMVGT